MRTISARELLSVQTDTAPFRYELLVDEIRAGDFLCESYGVAARNEENGDYAAVRNITTDQAAALKLLDLLTRNRVSPVTLRDVVCDFLEG